MAGSAVELLMMHSTANWDLSTCSSESKSNDMPKISQNSQLGYKSLDKVLLKNFYVILLFGLVNYKTADANLLIKV